MRDVGCPGCIIYDGVDVLGSSGVTNSGGLGKKPTRKGALGAKKGVLFVTYSLLVSGGRFESIVQWLAGFRNDNNSTNSNIESGRVQNERDFDGVIIFDEAHRAKNVDSDTLTHRAVVNLQERLPKARILYCSATGVSDVKHMAYATRLGLWGGGASSIYPTFDAFRHVLERRSGGSGDGKFGDTGGGGEGTKGGGGVGVLEMLALEMKRMGTFVARTLSWEGADFSTIEIKLNRSQQQSYDEVAKWWRELRQEIDRCITYLSLSSSTAISRNVYKSYWSSYQRCFREMAICAKVDYVVASTKEYLARDHSVVIGLQSTGEAGMQMALDNAVAQYEDSRKGGTSKINRYSEIQKSHKKSIGYNKNGPNYNSIVLPRLLSTVASTMAGFVINHFPISHPPLEPPIIPPVPAVGFANWTERIEHERIVNEARRIESLPSPSPLPELVGRRDSFLGRITTMNLPPNALDDIIDQLGGPGQVAELTGRSSRIVRVTDGKNDHNSKKGNDVSYRHEKRKTDSLSSTSSATTYSSTESERLNVEEREHFTEGTKTVAVISDASSTGISLHAERGTGSSHRRRVHFTIEVRVMVLVLFALPLVYYPF